MAKTQSLWFTGQLILIVALHGRRLPNNSTRKLVYPMSIPLPEYPRPALRRDSFENLNGRWQYAITSTAQLPAQWDGEILVPYSPESCASGVNRTLQPGQWLHYRRSFSPCLLYTYALRLRPLRRSQHPRAGCGGLARCPAAQHSRPGFGPCLLYTSS